MRDSCSAVVNYEILFQANYYVKLKYTAFFEKDFLFLIMKEQFRFIPRAICGQIFHKEDRGLNWAFFPSCTVD